MELTTMKEDTNKRKINTKWKTRKLESLKLARTYYTLGNFTKAERIRDCGIQLTFKECPNGHSKKLTYAHFCKVRLCPMCAWRRSLKLIQQLRLITHKANKKHKIQWLFLTLTVQNVSASELSNEITKMFKAWQRLSQRSIFRNSVVGWFRALEVTMNPQSWTFHPHLHILLAVKPSYFSGTHYITQRNWVSLWRESLQVEYQPIIDIRRVKTNRNKRKEMQYLSEMEQQAAVESAVLEVAKYPIKPESYLVDGNKQATETAVAVLDKALTNRRMVAYGGILKDIWNGLNDDDKNEDKLTEPDIDCKCETCNSDLLEQIYKWHAKNKDYLKI
jgi:plasmid rolling circle replication initiator protein Rep